MKTLKIEVAIQDDKVATAVKTEGYKGLEGQFVLLGVLENLKGQVLRKITLLGEKNINSED